MNESVVKRCPTVVDASGALCNEPLETRKHSPVTFAGASPDVEGEYICPKGHPLMTMGGDTVVPRPEG